MYSPRITNKKPKTNWFEYEPHEHEPKVRNVDVSPELADELLDGSYFLKKRVWRNMKKIRKQYAQPVYRYTPAKRETKRFGQIHKYPLPRSGL